MADTDPEELGTSLAKSVDQEALYAESDGESVDDLLPEIFHSFKIQFSNIQHELLDTALMDELSSRYTSPENMTKEGLVTSARNDARYALLAYADALVADGSVALSDLPGSDSSIFSFKSAIVDGYWRDIAQDRIEQYIDSE